MTINGCGKILTLGNVLKMFLAVIGLVLTITIAPLVQNIAKAEHRIEAVERVEIPFIKEELVRLRMELIELRARMAAQTETLQKIAIDVEYLRRKAEGQQ